MTAAVKRFLYRRLSMEGYLRLLQRGFFFMYACGILRLSREFDYHYRIKKLIRKGDVIMDIGANLGYYSILFARWTGPSGHVHAVEPIPVYNKIFAQKARRYGNITLHSCALGGEDKSVEMVMPLEAGYLRTGLPHVSDPQRDGRGDELRFKTAMKNPGRLFGGLEKLDYVKCDVEGFEYEALSAMKEILARFHPKVQVEVWPQNADALGTLFADIGYKPFRLENGRLTPLDGVGNGTGSDIIFIHKTNLT